MPCYFRMNKILLKGLLWLYIITLRMMVASLEPGFLDFDNLPDTNFTCVGKVIGGYYADLETNCQMFHVCTIGQLDEPMDIRFLCLNGTVFDQETRVCERIDEVDCSKSERFYSLNLELYGNTQPSILEETPETEAPIVIKASTSTTTSTTTVRPQTSKPSRQPYFPTTVRSDASNEDSEDISSQHFPLGNTPDIRFNPEEINISLNPGAPPNIRTRPISFQQHAYSDNVNSNNNNKIVVTTHTTAYNSDSKNVPTNHPIPVSSSTEKPRPIDDYDLTLNKNLDSATPSDINYGFNYHRLQPNRDDYRTELPNYNYHYHNLANLRPPGLTVHSYLNDPFRSSTHRNEYILTTRKSYNLQKSPTSTRYSYLSPLKSPHHHVFHRNDRQQNDNLPTPDIPTLSPLVFSSPAPFMLSRHIETKRYTNEHQLPPRIIISASASVSDASGRRLNYSLGTIGAAQLLEQPPSSYDEYKEEDVSLDPFYHDVPKVKQEQVQIKSKHGRKKREIPTTIKQRIRSKMNRQKRASKTEQLDNESNGETNAQIPKIKKNKFHRRSKREARNNKLNHSDIIRNEQEAVDVLKFLFDWYKSHSTTSERTITIPVKPDIITAINHDLPYNDESHLETQNSEVQTQSYFPTPSERTTALKDLRDIQIEDLFEIGASDNTNKNPATRIYESTPESFATFSTEVRQPNTIAENQNISHYNTNITSNDTTINLEETALKNSTSEDSEDTVKSHNAQKETENKVGSNLDYPYDYIDDNYEPDIFTSDVSTKYSVTPDHTTTKLDQMSTTLDSRIHFQTEGNIKVDENFKFPINDSYNDSNSFHLQSITSYNNIKNESEIGDSLDLEANSDSLGGKNLEEHSKPRGKFYGNNYVKSSTQSLIEPKTSRPRTLNRGNKRYNGLATHIHKEYQTERSTGASFGDTYSEHLKESTFLQVPHSSTFRSSLKYNDYIDDNYEAFTHSAPTEWNEKTKNVESGTTKHHTALLFEDSSVAITQLPSDLATDHKIGGSKDYEYIKETQNYNESDSAKNNGENDEYVDDHYESIVGDKDPIDEIKKNQNETQYTNDVLKQNVGEVQNEFSENLNTRYDKETDYKVTKEPQQENTLSNGKDNGNSGDADYVDDNYEPFVHTLESVDSVRKYKEGGYRNTNDIGNFYKIVRNRDKSQFDESTTEHLISTTAKTMISSIPPMESKVNASSDSTYKYLVDLAKSIELGLLHFEDGDQNASGGQDLQPDFQSGADNNGTTEEYEFDELSSSGNISEVFTPKPKDIQIDSSYIADYNSSTNAYQETRNDNPLATGDFVSSVDLDKNENDSKINQFQIGSEDGNDSKSTTVAYESTQGSTSFTSEHIFPITTITDNLENNGEVSHLLEYIPTITEHMETSSPQARPKPETTRKKSFSVNSTKDRHRSTTPKIIPTSHLIRNTSFRSRDYRIRNRNMIRSRHRITNKDDETKKVIAADKNDSVVDTTLTSPITQVETTTYNTPSTIELITTEVSSTTSISTETSDSPLDLYNSTVEYSTEIPTVPTTNENFYLTTSSIQTAITESELLSQEIELTATTTLRNSNEFTIPTPLNVFSETSTRFHEELPSSLLPDSKMLEFTTDVPFISSTLPSVIFIVKKAERMDENETTSTEETNTPTIQTTEIHSTISEDLTTLIAEVENITKSVFAMTTINDTVEQDKSTEYTPFKKIEINTQINISEEINTTTGISRGIGNDTTTTPKYVNGSTPTGISEIISTDAQAKSNNESSSDESSTTESASSRRRNKNYGRNYRTRRPYHGGYGPRKYTPKHRFSTENFTPRGPKHKTSTTQTLSTSESHKHSSGSTETTSSETDISSTDPPFYKSVNPTQAESSKLNTTPLSMLYKVEIRKEKVNRQYIFNCFGKPLNKFYSDPRDCRLFHYCTRGYNKNQLLDMKFVCDFGTYFDEEKLICTKETPLRCL